VLDLGCGPADVTVRLARELEASHLLGVDGSEAMLRHGRERVDREGLSSRIDLVTGYLPGAVLPRKSYDLIVSNSLLHHLKDPLVLWTTLKGASDVGTHVFVMDLLRPESDAAARSLVARYAADEPEVLKRDFLGSLRAAYRTSEVRAQLSRAGLDALSVEEASDRHLIVFGEIGPG
jgi:ubiquinone/menaquinone biosynthesis C-methylase UbiE